MKIISSLLLISSLSSSAAFADSFEELQFVEQVASLDPSVISPAEEEVPTYLGRVTNRSTQQSIEIDCIEGTKSSCKRIGFYLVSGVKQDQPFKTVTVNTLESTLSKHKPKFRYFVASRWIFDQEDPVTPFFFGIGEIMVLVDTLIAPIRFTKHTMDHAIAAKTYRKARLTLYRAMNTGATVTVSDKQFQRLRKILLTGK